MAKFELRFFDITEDKEFLSVYKSKMNVNDKETDVVTINIGFLDDDGGYHINLDKSTAIKFAKTLRTEINKITEMEVKHEK